jgi:hypothetical protein
VGEEEMENLSIPKTFMATTDTHYHKPITRRIYYNNCIVMVTNCSDCREELSRWLVEESYTGQLNTNIYSASVVTTSCNRTVS